ncbi:hypothetical protein OAK17_06575 [Alphaproteobacteria bacterium]|nr:hypothetical protein [Alphaproteobacteria bacterium]|tara:strand:+ start:277 stop:402 length:126 start_codon:yes stop_codon:yes gene_type:complete
MEKNSQRQRNIKRKNIVVALCLVSFVVLIYLGSLVRSGGAS